MQRLFHVVAACAVIVLVVLLGYVRTGGSTAAAQPRVSQSAMVSVGREHACALSSAGTVKCWGGAYYGQLGSGNTTSVGASAATMGANLAAVDFNGTAKVLSAGREHTCVIRSDNTTVCWGLNLSGQLGLGSIEQLLIGDGPGEMGSALATVDLSPSYAVSLSASSNYSCAVLANASVKCWGQNDYGQLGVEGTHGMNTGEMGTNLPAVDLGTGRTALAVTTGFGHACALLDNKKIKCWGNNSDGQLGYGDKTNRVYPNLGNKLAAVNVGTGRTVKQIAAGGRFTCALLDNGTVKCWGANESGQLGIGSKRTIGDGTGEMGDALVAVNLGVGRTATAIAVSQRGDSDQSLDYACALLDNGTVKCWGKNDFGQLGQGDTDNRGDAAGEMAALQPVNLGTGITALQVSIGTERTCVRIMTTDIKCFGRNSGGQLGTGNTVYYGSSADSIGDAIPIVDLDGLTATVTPTPTISNTPTITKTWTKTRTPTKSPTRTRTRTRTPTKKALLP